MHIINSETSISESYIHAETLSLLDRKSILLFFLYISDIQDYECDISDIVYSFNNDFLIIINITDEIISDTKNIVDKKNDLDLIIQKYLKNWHIDRISLMTKLILRIGIYELQKSEVAPIIVINNIVELSKGYAEEGSFRIINGVLDAYYKKEIAV